MLNKMLMLRIFRSWIIMMIWKKNKILTIHMRILKKINKKKMILIMKMIDKKNYRKLLSRCNKQVKLFMKIFKILKKKAKRVHKKNKK